MHENGTALQFLFASNNHMYLHTWYIGQVVTYSLHWHLDFFSRGNLNSYQWIIRVITGLNYNIIGIVDDCIYFIDWSITLLLKWRVFIRSLSCLIWCLTVRSLHWRFLEGKLLMALYRYSQWFPLRAFRIWPFVIVENNYALVFSSSVHLHYFPVAVFLLL